MRRHHYATHWEYIVNYRPVLYRQSSSELKMSIFLGDYHSLDKVYDASGRNKMKVETQTLFLFSVTV